jgi:hypothetical protein
MRWDYSLDTHIWIFAVGRGNAAFIRTGLNQGFILDMNAIDFDVAKFIKENFEQKLDAYENCKIAQAVLSHPHADHIQQCAELRQGSPLHPKLLTCPHDKDPEGGSASEKLNWNRVCNRDSDKESVEAYKSLFAKRTLPLQTIRYVPGRTIPNLEYGIFYIRPPVCEQIHPPKQDNEYANATSIMFYLRHGSNSILFPGDMTPEGMNYVLAERDGVEKRFTRFDSGWAQANPTQHCKTGGQPSLASLLQNGLTILVAPHHGLESCYGTPIFKAMRGGKPKLVVISERVKAHENDGNTHRNYHDCASGLPVQVEGGGLDTMYSANATKYSINTKSDHHILAVFENSGGTRVYANRDASRLLTKL